MKPAPLRPTRPRTRRPPSTISRPTGKVRSPSSLALYAHTELTQVYARSIPPPIPLRFCYAGLSRSPPTTHPEATRRTAFVPARAPTTTADDSIRAAPCSRCPVARGHARRAKGGGGGGASRPARRGRSERARELTDLDRVGHRVSLFRCARRHLCPPHLILVPASSIPRRAALASALARPRRTSSRRPRFVRQVSCSARRENGGWSAAAFQARSRHMAMADSCMSIVLSPLASCPFFSDIHPHTYALAVKPDARAGPRACGRSRAVR
jgi:hypothetical protein